jgi:hypothetical protein
MTLAKHPDLLNRTTRQIQNKLYYTQRLGIDKRKKFKVKCMNVCKLWINKQNSINRNNGNKSTHRRKRRSQWTKEEEQPLLDLTKQTSTAFQIDWEDISKNPVLACRTTTQIKEKWKYMKRRESIVQGISSALPSLKEDACVLNLCKGTEAGSLFQKPIRVAEAFQGRPANECSTLRTYAKEESAKHICAVSKATSASVADAPTAQCDTTDAAGSHKEENAQQFGRQLFYSKGLLGRSERDKTCGDCADTGASEQHGPNSSADNSMPLAMVHGSNNSFIHKGGPVVAAVSSTSTSDKNISTNQQKRKLLAVLPSMIRHQVSQGADKTLPGSLLAPTYYTNWASLNPKKNEEAFNGIVSWPLFDDLA